METPDETKARFKAVLDERKKSIADYYTLSHEIREARQEKVRVRYK